MLGISIIVCCYNSALRLPETLAYLARQQVSPHIPWEVIIVNNASKDNTAQVAKEEWSRFGKDIPFRVIDQPLPGLSAAREKGLEESRFEYMLWCDDDNWLAPDYVEKGFELMTAMPNVAMLGGLAVGAFEVPPPAWFDRYKFLFAVGPQLEKSGLLPRQSGYIYGAGAILRKTSWLAINKLAFEPLSSDRKGKALSGGHDVEMGLAFRLAGYDLYYSDTLVLQHFMPPDRMTDEYLIRLATGSATSNMASILYYFFFRHPQLTLTRFIYLYQKRLLTSLYILAKNQKINIPFLFKTPPNKHIINHLEEWMLWQNFKMSVASWPAAKAGFAKINNFKQKIEDKKSVNA